MLIEIGIRGLIQKEKLHKISRGLMAYEMIMKGKGEDLGLFECAVDRQDTTKQLWIVEGLIDHKSWKVLNEIPAGEGGHLCIASIVAYLEK